MFKFLCKCRRMKSDKQSDKQKDTQKEKQNNTNTQTLLYKNNTYTLTTDEIGYGHYGKVIKGIMNNKIICAIKKINNKNYKENETVCLRIINTHTHPNIFKIYDMFQYDNKHYIVSELYSGGEIFDKIKTIGKFKESDANKI